MKKLFNYLIVAVLLLLCACGGATYISPDKMTVNFPIDGGFDNVNIDADGSWEITSCPDWIIAEKQEEGLSLKTDRNETGKILQGDIVLKGKDGVEISISVTQATKCTHITPAEEMVEFDKEGGSKTINIDTDGSLQVTAPEGFTASFADGVLTVTAGANDGGKRSGDIKLTADEQSATIAVSQKGNVCPRCNGTGKVKCSKCGGKGYWIHNDGSYPYVVGCGKCGGIGEGCMSDGYGLRDALQDVYRLGRGKVSCPECGGSGH